MTIGKPQVRDQMRARRAALGDAEHDAAARRLRDHVLAAPFMRGVTRVMCYCAHAGEIDTLPLIAALIAERRRVCVPLIVGRGVMHAHRITSTDELAPGRFGIPAPIRPDPVDAAPQVTLCPGLAFTPRGERVGSGAGYYDRFLAAHGGVVPVGLAYDFQIVGALPVDRFDRPMRYLVTDARVIDCAT